jgi:hypothetical protein
MKVTAEPNMAQLADAERALRGVKDGVPRALMRSVNHSLGPTRTAMIRTTREKVRVKAKTLKGYFFYNRATLRDPSGKVIAQGPPIPAIYFKPKPPTNRRWIRGTKKRANPPAVGVSIELPKVGRRTLPGAFIVERAKAWPRADDRDGPKFHVVERVDRRRLPIRIVHGVTMAEVLADDLTKLALQAQDRLWRRVHHEIGRLLETGR